MLKDLQSFLPLSATAVAIVTVTYCLFKYLNKTVNENIRLRVALWLLDDVTDPKWAESVTTLFNKIFGKRYFSWQRLRATAVLTLIFGCLIRYATKTDETGWFAPDYSMGGWLSFAFVLLSYNTFVDYISICKSERFLKIVSDSTGAGKLILLMLADSLSGICVAILSLLILWMPLQNIGLFDAAARELHGGLGLDDLTLNAFVLPLIQNVWVAIFVSATLLAKFTVWMSRQFSGLARLIDQKRIEKEPLTLIGEFACILQTLIFAGIGLTRS